MNRHLLRERFGRIITRDLEHCATPMRRSVMAELEREFAEDFARTAASRFRSATDISVTNSLYHYYALLTGRAMATTQPRVQYIQTTLAASLGRMERLLERRDVDMFCLNDGGSRRDARRGARARRHRHRWSGCSRCARRGSAPSVSAERESAPSAERSGSLAR